MTQSAQDMWSQWLLNRRFGGDLQRMQEMLDCLYPIRDKILSRVQWLMVKDCWMWAVATA
jgi:hypothetical protein